MDINIILCHWNKIGYVQIFRLTDLSDILMILRSLEFVLDRIVCLLCLSGTIDAIRYCAIWLFAFTHQKMKLWCDPANRYPKSRRSALLKKIWKYGLIVTESVVSKTIFHSNTPFCLCISQKQSILSGFCFHHGSITRVLFTYTQ